MISVIHSIRAKNTKPPTLVLTVVCGEKTAKYNITEGTYRSIGCPLSGEEIDAATMEVIAREDEERRALAKALSVLSYSDKNRRELYARLISAGFSAPAAKAAVKECVIHGYVNESRQLEHLVMKYARALEGPTKICARLTARGYSKNAILETVSELTARGEIDLEQSKQLLISKKYPEGASSEEIKKLLYKHGYFHD